jgi:hypothetical protein
MGVNLVTSSSIWLNSSKQVESPKQAKPLKKSLQDNQDHQSN